MQVERSPRGPCLAGVHGAHERLLEEARGCLLRRRPFHPPSEELVDVCVGPRVGHAVLPLDAIDPRSSAAREARMAAAPYRTLDLTVPIGIPRVSAISEWLSAK